MYNFGANGYISCIKLNGRPILPPLVTPESRKDLEKYKLEAVAIEKQLQISKYKKRVSDIVRQFHTLEHQLAFKSNEEFKENRPRTTSKVPLRNGTVNLSCNIVDVTEYRDDSVEQFDKLVAPKAIKLFEYEICDSNTTELACPLNKTSSEPATSPNQSPQKSQLIRSNSYTLESPSPALIAHFESCKVSKNDASPVHSFSWSDNDKVETCDTVVEAKSTIVAENECEENCGQKEKKLEILEEKDLKLLKILNNIPVQCTKQIFDLLEENDFDRFKELLLKDKFSKILGSSLQPTIQTPIVPQINDSNHPITPTSSDKTSVTSSQTLFYTITSNETINGATTPLGNLIDLDSDCDTDTKCQFTPLQRPLCEFKSNLNCSRELFPVNAYQNEEKAASIIGAHVRGYLTRRLLRTEKVRTLIQTIKDALICAMDLHAESTENINEADVELHRRLIQQVSAACFAFHEVFFNLTIAEQMGVIANDRHRQKERSKRPSSTGSGRRSSMTTQVK